MPDIPLDQAANKAMEITAHEGLFWQKFTCIHCGSRQTMETPNALYSHGTCEGCGKETCIHKTGCGLVVSFYMPARFRTEEMKNGHPTGD